MKLFTITMRSALLILFLAVMAISNAETNPLQPKMGANNPPTTPSNPSPSSGATGVATSRTFSWSCSDPEGGSVGYDLYMGTSSSSMSLKKSGTGTSAYISGLNEGQKYYWRVIAYDNNNASATGPIWNFTTASSNSAPNTPSNPSPSSGATGIATSRTFSWICSDPDGDDVGYDLYMGTSSSSLSLKKSGSGTSAYISGLNAGQKYYWRIIAYDESNASTTGPLWNFTTASSNNAPNTPSNPSPSNGATGIATSRTFSWTCTDPDGDDVGYDLYMGTSSSNMTLKKSGSGTSAYISGLNAGQKYYWRIVAYDEDDASTTGPTWYFTTASSNNAPNTPSNPSPSNGATGIATSRTFSWTCTDPDGDDVGYDLYMGTSSSSMSLKKSGTGTSAYISNLSEGQTYYWQVIAYDEDNASTTGPTWSFTTVSNQPPTTPTNPSPSNGATGVSTSPTLSWSCSDPEGGSVGYDLYYGTSSSSLSYHVGGTGTSVTLSGLSNGQTYYWRVVAYDPQDNSTTGPIWSFTTVSNQPPTTPSSPSPFNGATGVSTSPTLSWSCSDPEGGSVGFDLYYGTSSASLSNHVSGTGTSVTLSGLSNGQTYYWKVVAYDQQNISTTGPIWSFTTEVGNQPPTTPSNPTPSNGATGVSTNPSLSWSCSDPEGGSVGYNVFYGTTSSSLPYYVGGVGTSTTLTGLNANQTYYWKVVAYDQQNNSTQGPIWQFTTGDADCFDDCTSSNCGEYGNEMYVAAQYLCNMDIVEGIDYSLEPDIDITRSQLAKIALYGLYNGPSNVPNPLVTDYFPSIYPDLQDASTYYYRAAKALLYLEYGDGISPFDRDRSIFDPEGTIERCLVLKVLLETFNIAPATGGSTPFSDYLSSENFWGYAKKAYDLNIVQTTVFRPYDYCTRGEAFLYLYRILTGIASNTIPNPNPVNTESPATSSFFIPANLSPEVVNAMRGVEYGNFSFYNKDFFDIPGYMDLSFGVTYNSYLTEMPDDFYPVKPLGKAWTHTYDMYMNIVTDAYNNTSNYVFHMQDGSLLIYNNSLSSVTEGNYYELTVSGSNKYILKSRDQISYTFERQATSDGIYYLTQIKDRNNNAISISYSYGNSHYRITSVSTLGRTLNFYYTSGTDLLYYVNDPINRKVYFYYTDGQLTSLKDAKSQTTSFSYGTMDFEKGLLKEITLPLGNHVYNNYQQRKLTSTKYNNDTPTTITFTPNYQNNSCSSTVTQPLSGSQSIVTNYTMNGKNRITNVNDNCNTNVSYEYNISGSPDLVSKETDNKTNIQTTYEYNNKGLVTSKTVSVSGQSKTETSTYTSYNDVHTYTDANGNTTTYNYTNGNLTSIVDALGKTTSFTNNSYGKPTQVTDPSGVVLNYSYNSYGNEDGFSIPSLNLTSATTFDNVSRISSITDFAGHSTGYTYDNNDNVLTETDAQNHTTSYSFDANDNLTQVTNAKGYNTDLTYDNNDFLASVTFQGATKSYTYNRDGSMATFTNPNGYTFNYTYNNSGELTNDGYASYSYNSKGQISSITKDGKSISYSYDAFGRVSSIAYDGKTVSYTYDNNDNVLTITYPGSKTVTYTYDALNRMTSVKDWNNKTTTYNYRNDGQINYYQYPNNVRTTYSYDASGRCTGLSTKRNSGNGSVLAEYNFTLDNLGNHTQESLSEPYAVFPSIPSDNISYSYNNANRLVSAGNLSFGYDNNGNTTSRTGRTYGYDVKNNLTSVSGDYSASYTYDGLGNRRSATRNGVTRQYVLDLLGDMSNVLMETDGSGNVVCYYIYGASGLISRIDASSNTSYYVYDFRGSTVAITDATSSSNITHRYQYDDFGKLLQVEEADENLFRFVGKYGVMYEDSALVFMRARYYDPEIGRFLSEDPIWSDNLYPYVNNNPIAYLDPKGEKTCEEMNNQIEKWENKIDRKEKKVERLTNKLERKKNKIIPNKKKIKRLERRINRNEKRIEKLKGKIYDLQTSFPYTKCTIQNDIDGALGTGAGKQLFP